MHGRSAAITLALSMLILNLAHATQLGIIGPIGATLSNNATIHLGKVGPGESFYVLANSSAVNGKGVYVNIGWDTLKAISLPSGWSSQASPLYENPMKTKITVSPNAQNGTYLLEFRAVNVQNYSGLGNLTFYAYVNVTPDVFNLNVQPTQLSAGIDQPVNIYVTINNTGISDDPFTISAEGLPAWNITRDVISLHSTTNTYQYPVFEDEPAVYHFNLTVGASTSRLISKSYPMKLVVKESLLSDFNSVGNGVVLTPVVFEPVYALMTFISGLLRSHSIS